MTPRRLRLRLHKRLNVTSFPGAIGGTTMGAGKARGLQIRLLGELALLRHGRALPLPPSKKTRALLAYLAVTGKPQLRRSADAITAARSQAEAGRCLILIEREIGKAKELLEGAHAVLVNDQDDLMLTWGLGLLKRYTGESEEATRRLHQAAVLARRIDSHWEETECLRALTLLALEQDDVPSARALCPLLMALAAKMGEGSERPIAEALESLARVLQGDGAARTRLISRSGRVRDADAKGMLATVLNFAAEHDLAHGRLRRARGRATEALAAAQAVERHNQVAIARATLARVAIRAREGQSADAELEPLRLDLEVPFALSAYARNAVERALRELDGSPPARAENRAKIFHPTSSRSR